MSYQQYKAWLDAANAAADIPDFHKAVKSEISGLIADGVIGWQRSDTAATAICYADHCTAPLLARIAELEAALTMRPISEAPQDGTQYLAWNGVSHMVLNQPDESYSIGEWELVDGEWIGHHVGHHPTHFLPLPTPPKGDAS